MTLSAFSHRLSTGMHFDGPARLVHKLSYRYIVAACSPYYHQVCPTPPRPLSPTTTTLPLVGDPTPRLLASLASLTPYPHG